MADGILMVIFILGALILLRSRQKLPFRDLDTDVSSQNTKRQEAFTAAMLDPKESK